MTKKEICDKLNVSTKTFERFIGTQGESGKPKGSSHERNYSNIIFQKFKKWLVKNQLSQGKPTGAKTLTAAVRDTGSAS